MCTPQATGSRRESVRRHDPSLRQHLPHAVTFSTELLIKDTAETHREVIRLYPLTTAELLDMLPPCSLSLQTRYADFSGTPAMAEDDSHIVVLRRV